MLSAKDKKGIWIIVGVIGVLGAIVIAQAMVGAKPKPGGDNCLGEVTRNTVFLLDYSEEISEQTLDEIVSRALTRINNNVKTNERVSIFTISELSKNSLKPVVSLCKPPSEGSRAVENVRAIKKRFENNFEIPVRNALSRQPTESKESPIAQALTDISLSHYLSGSSNTLVVFSDMLENTEKYSLYKCTNPENSIAQYRNSRKGAMERPAFKNTNVELNLMPRLGQKDEVLKCRDRLWIWFFGQNEGTDSSVKISYLPGGSPGEQKITGLKK